jgi:hypothetical protein
MRASSILLHDEACLGHRHWGLTSWSQAQRWGSLDGLTTSTWWSAKARRERPIHSLRDRMRPDRVAQLISPASCLVEKVTRDRDCAIYKLRPDLSTATGTEQQWVAARRPARNDLIAWTDDTQGQILSHRFEFEPDGMSFAKPRSIEQRVKLPKLLSAGGC